MEWKQKVLNLAAKRHWFLLAAVLIIVAGLASALIPGGLKYGIDFQSGITATIIADDTELSLDGLRQELAALGQDRADVRSLGVDEDEDGVPKPVYFIRVGMMGGEELDDFRQALNGLGVVLEFDTVSPVIATHTARNAGIAMGVAAIAMLLYITWAFRKVPNPFRYGVTAITALIFNLLVVLGIFSILGRFLNWEVDPMFITAILAIIGYSVNDTIVVLDRIRENKTRNITPDFDTTVNISVTETLARSLNTSATTALAVTAIYLIVGGPIRSFLLALFVGIVAGAYSSIFVGGPLLVAWEHREWKKLIPRLPRLRRSGA